MFKKLLYNLFYFYRGYPPYKIVNGVKVRYTSRNSVNREDAIKANWETIKSLCGKKKND